MERINDVLFISPPVFIPDDVTGEERFNWEIFRDHDIRARNYILAFMSNDL